MNFLKSYRRFNRIIEREIFEPTLNWGLRMGVATVVPIIWGISTGNTAAAEWMSLTAECIAWVELRGSAGLRFRVLMGGILLTFFFAFIGSVTGYNIYLSVFFMLPVAFISSLFKNLGDRGSGLAISVYLMFIICNAYPANDIALEQRMLYIFAGGVWNLIVGMLASAFIPEQAPYRRTLAIILKSVSSLIQTVAKGWDGKSTRSNLREIYLKEKEVRAAIDSSLHFYESMADQVNNKNNREYHLAQIRKATALVAAHIIAMSEELESISYTSLQNDTRQRIYALFKALQQTAEHMAIYMLNLKPEEELILLSRIERLHKLLLLLKESNTEQKSINRIVQLSERSIKLVESSISRLKLLGNELPVYRSYSLIKTIYVLHPRYLLRNLKLLFNLNTFTARYALRSALAATLALFIYKWYHIDHGYWLAFTVLIVIQPHFGATYKKAIDRIVGTVLGGITGGLLAGLPAHMHLKELILFISAVLMIYFIRKKYSIAAFFITVSLVLLFSVQGEFNQHLLFVRAACTLAGAGLAVIAGFILLPAHDKKWLPRYLSEALSCNYSYFTNAFFNSDVQTWTRSKRSAEIKNSNLFDSFTRFTEEFKESKRLTTLYFQLITHSVRVTRELTNIMLEEDSKTAQQKTIETDLQQLKKINECFEWFNKNLFAISTIYTTETQAITNNSVSVSSLTPYQEIYLEKMLIELKAMHSDLVELTEKH